MSTESIRKLLDSATENRNAATLSAAGLEGEAASLHGLLSACDSLLAIALVQSDRLEKSGRMDALLHDNLPWYLERVKKVLEPPACCTSPTNWPAFDDLIGACREAVRNGDDLPAPVAEAMRALERDLPPADLVDAAPAEHGAAL